MRPRTDRYHLARDPGAEIGLKHPDDGLGPRPARELDADQALVARNLDRDLAIVRCSRVDGVLAHLSLDHALCGTDRALHVWSFSLATVLITEARARLGLRQHRDRGEDAEVGQGTASVELWSKRQLVRARFRGSAQVDDEPTDLTRADERSRLHRRTGPIRERQRSLGALDPLVPARGTGVAERDDPVDRPVRPRGRIRTLRFEGGAVRAERRKLEGRARECGRHGRCGLEHLVEPRVELALEIRRETRGEVRRERRGNGRDETKAEATEKDTTPPHTNCRSMADPRRPRRTLGPNDRLDARRCDLRPAPDAWGGHRKTRQGRIPQRREAKFGP